ncbi:hypothetical protein GWI33_014822 [Rhynchophorus ferrugineus]|uniref:Uncharacterized protein n=1 Tax=Rhynchophorus ferrugineus TaxID=354439 RepID=A0A834I6L4_RHYFE|nr:hypothetical protein GWI33_014822 [Rhynchophorus ferrugineus]
MVCPLAKISYGLKNIKSVVGTRHVKFNTLSKIKSFLLVTLIAGLVLYVSAELSEEQKQKVVSYGKECISATGVDKEIVHKAHERSFSDNPKLKAFAFCMSKKIGLQSDSGEVQTEVLKQKLSSVVDDPDTVHSLISACVQKKDTPEETAYQTFVCYHEKNPNHSPIF